VIRSARVPSARAGAIVVATATLCLTALAAPPALAQLTFSSTPVAIPGNAPSDIVASDFNGDSHLDLATANFGFLFDEGGVDVLLGSANGTFIPPAEELPADDGPISLDPSDFNGDGHVDLAVANNSSADLSVLLGAGDGTFGAPTNYPVGPTCPDRTLIAPAGVVVGFFNADAIPDVAVANHGCNNVSILVGKGDGTFGAATDVGVGDGPEAVATGDFDRDGNLDLVVPNAGPDADGASILLGRGDGTFTGAPNVPAGPNPDAVAVGDFDGDGISDLAFADDSGFSGDVSIVLGNGDGTFAQPLTDYTVGSSSTSVAVGDFNDDAVLDVVSTDESDSAVYVLLGAGDGTFSRTPSSFPADEPDAVIVAKLDSDPVFDMATANSPGGVNVLLNTTPLPSTAPTVDVAPGGSCAVSGQQGTIRLALAAAETPTSELSLSMTSSNPALVPTRNITLGGSGTSRTLTVRPIAGRSGSAVVTVNRLSDGQLTGSVRVTVRVAGNGRSSATGDDGPDVLFGQNGADTLAGMGDNDLLCGGNGADDLSGGAGDDTLDGGRGKDRLSGGPGADRFIPGPGKDGAIDFNPAEGDTQNATLP
jgi:Ca2+-binding RTX toxin-like protein